MFSYNLYFSPNIVLLIKLRIMRWVGHVACVGKKINVYRILMEQPEGKGPLARPRHRWKDNIKTDLNRIGCEGVYWIDLTRNRASGAFLWTRWWTFGKAIPLQAWIGPWGSRTLRLPEFLDSRHMNMVKFLFLRTGRLYPQEISLVLTSVRGWVDPSAVVPPYREVNPRLSDS